MKQRFRKAHISHFLCKYEEGDTAPFIGSQNGERIRMTFRYYKEGAAAWATRECPTRYEKSSPLATPSHKRRELARRGGAFLPASRTK